MTVFGPRRAQSDGLCTGFKWSVALAFLVFLLPSHVIAQTRVDPVMLPAEEHDAWQAIGRVNRAGYRNKQMCSGTLVDPETVLTADHCVRDAAGNVLPVEELQFVAGWFRGTAAAHSPVSAITLHPEVTLSTESNWHEILGDAVLLKLAVPIESVQPIPMARVDPEGAFRILGYRWDRPHALSDSGACPMRESPPGTMLLTCPVTFGTSGAPVLQRQLDEWRVVASVSAMSEALTATIPVPEIWLPR